MGGEKKETGKIAKLYAKYWRASRFAPVASIRGPGSNDEGGRIVRLWVGKLAPDTEGLRKSCRSSASPMVEGSERCAF